MNFMTFAAKVCARFCANPGLDFNEKESKEDHDWREDAAKDNATEIAGSIF